MYTADYAEDAPTPEEVRRWRGLVVLEFGTSWCPICRAAQASIQDALAPLEAVPHIKVEDGPGRKLGRLFRVKLWPTLVFLRDGQEVRRVVRPGDGREIGEALDAAGGS